MITRQNIVNKTPSVKVAYSINSPNIVELLNLTEAQVLTDGRVMLYKADGSAYYLVPEKLKTFVKSTTPPENKDVLWYDETI